MANSDIFLATFSEIESWLRKQAGVDRGTPFYQLIERASYKNRAVAQYRDDLKEFADLRNAIVHERSDDGHVIAEPNDRSVAAFQIIRTALINPPAVIPRFTKKVLSRPQSDSVGDAVTDMRTGAFSQLPILLDGKVIALLTAETVVRWLATQVHNKMVNPWETAISAVIPHAEHEDHYCFVSRRTTLLEALLKFEDFAARGRSLDAILISENGRPDQKLLGILTIFDLPAILDSLGLKRIPRP